MPGGVETGPSDHLLDKPVELSTFEELSLREMFEQLGAIFFEGRVTVEGLEGQQFLDHISTRPLREILDRMCENRCVWSVDGSPPALHVRGLEA